MMHLLLKLCSWSVFLGFWSIQFKRTCINISETFKEMNHSIVFPIKLQVLYFPSRRVIRYTFFALFTNLILLIRCCTLVIDDLLVDDGDLNTTSSDCLLWTSIVLFDQSNCIFHQLCITRQGERPVARKSKLFFLWQFHC